MVQLLGARKNIDKLVQCFMVTPQLKWELNKNREKCNDTRFGLSSRTQNGAGSIFRSHFVCGFGFCIIIFFRPTFVYFFLSYLFKCLCVAYKSHLIYNAQHDQTNGTPNIENNNLSWLYMCLIININSDDWCHE